MRTRAKSTRRMLRAQLVRSRIVAAAGALFGRRGIEDVAVEDLLVEAEVSRRTFYKYFRNKDEVLVALFDIPVAAVLQALAPPVAPKAPALSELRGAIDRYLEFHVNPDPIVKVLAHEALRAGSPLAPARARFQERLMAITTAALERAVVKPPDALVYRALLGAVEAISIDLLDRDASPAAVEHAKAVLWDVCRSLLLPRKK